MKLNEAWKRMATGKYVDLNNLRVEDVDIKDIEVSLNNILRFTGHHKERKPLTVAQHSLLCLELVKLTYPDEDELYLKVFIHDFAEAYIGDISSPVKKALGKFFYDWADPIEHTTNMAFLNTPITVEEKQKIKYIDLMSLDIERRCMWNQMGKDKWPQVDESRTLEKKLELFDSAQSLEYVPLGDYLSDLK
tara:strand:+ start:2540 stop:3112 length:573 start_codon:yes stop_codon:yes gene_type:complete